MARLASAARGGDRTAFDTLMAHFDRPLRAFLTSRVPYEAVEDVLQETYIACWLGLSTYQGRSRFQVWLFGIAHHKSADQLRSRARQREDAIPVTLYEEAPAPGDDYLDAERRLDSRRLLALLPEAQREVLELYYYGDLTLDEVARTLGRGLNTVKSQFYRAHDRACSLLREDGDILSSTNLSVSGGTPGVTRPKK